MKPYKFEPYLKPTLWGGSQIAPFKGITTDQTNIGESWEISGVPGHESVTADRGLADDADLGLTLPQLIDKYKERLVGQKVYEQYGDQFPLLVKFIDSRQDLSVQVHPDDKLAQERHGCKGKTEMWYLTDTAPGAHLISGFSKGIDPDKYQELVESGKIVDVLADHTVQPGDVFFLPAGRIHAICGGCRLAEIQETSDITYRIFDYNRLGLDGKPRQLHTELAKAAIDYTVHPDYRTRYIPVENEEVELVRDSHFITSLFDLTQPLEVSLEDKGNFLAVICIEGSGLVGGVGINAGEALLADSSEKKISFVPEGAKLKLLTSYLPDLI